MKKMMAMALAAIIGTGLLAGCAASAPAPAAQAPQAAQEAAAPQGEAPDYADRPVYKVGIVSFMDHASLNQIQQNVEDGLNELEAIYPVRFDYKDYSLNGQGDATLIAQIMAQLKDAEVDAVVCIATPTALTAQSVFEGTDTPIIFSAVTDPVGAGLVQSFEAPGVNITGTSDMLNTEAIMNLILAQNPETAKVGLLYSTSEDSSTQAIADAKAFLDAKGIAYIEKTGTNTDEVSMAADALIAEKVDAIFTPTDNTVMSAELAIYEKLRNAGIPHYTGADSFALNGAFLGFGINYASLGKMTAAIVGDVLADGKAPAEYSVVTLENGIATINTETAEVLGIEMEAVKEAFAPYCSEIVEITTAENF